MYVMCDVQCSGTVRYHNYETHTRTHARMIHVIAAAFEEEGKAEGEKGENGSVEKVDNGGESEYVKNPVTDSMGVLELISMNTWANFRSPKARNVYDEMPSRAASRLCAEAHLRDHNTISDKPMNLILFDYALQHLARIVRILLIPGGHGEVMVRYARHA